MAGIFRPDWRPPPQQWIPSAPAAGGNVTITVDVPGSITWTGQTVALVTTITPTAGAVTWTGQALGLKTSITPTAGAITWTGQTVGLKTSITPTAGAITWTGSALGLKTTITPTAGNVTWQGQTVSFGGATTINVDVPGNITWTGQAVGLKTAITPTAGAVTWAGQQLGLKTSVNITAGAVTWTGQAVGLKTQVTPTAGNITWAGATNITLVSGGNVVISVTVPGAITWTGQTVTLLSSGLATSVKGPTRKLVLSGVNAISAPITFGSYDDTHVWDTIYDSGASYDGEVVLTPALADVTGNGATDSEELVTGVPRAVLVGSGRNSLQEV